MTLTQFLKMQLPEEPTSLPADTEEMEKRKGEREKRGAEKGEKLDWMVLSAHSVAQTQRNLNSYSCEEEETKKSE